MDKDYFMQLTLGLYRVTEMISDKEPLKFKIREKAGDILAELACSGFDVNLADFDRIIKDTSIINVYFDLAKEQEWVDARNFLVLKQGYANLREFANQSRLLAKKPLLNQINESPKQEKEYYNKRVVEQKTFVSKERSEVKKAKIENGSFPERKGEIYEIISKKGPLRLIEMLQYFPKVSKRTIRRDVGYLLKKGAISRYDQGKLTFYKLKNT